MLCIIKEEGLFFLFLRVAVETRSWYFSHSCSVYQQVWTVADARTLPNATIVDNIRSPSLEMLLAGMLITCISKIFCVLTLFWNLFTVAWRVFNQAQACFYASGLLPLLQIISENQCFLVHRHLLGGLAADCVFSSRSLSSEHLWCRRISTSIVPAVLYFHNVTWLHVLPLSIYIAFHILALCQKLKI